MNVTHHVPPGQMYRPVQQPSAPQNQQIVCSGCTTLLMYPHGASNVRCSRCHHITPVSQAAPDMAQIVCNGCCVLLMYPRGASSVQCSRCSTINGAVQQPQQNQLGHIVCGGCSVTLMYQFGAQSVKCALCNFVTGVAAHPQPSVMNMYQHSAHHQQPPLAVKPMQAVVVENPSTMDENGNEVANIAVGVKKES